MVDPDETGAGKILFEKLEKTDTNQLCAVLQVQTGYIALTLDIEDLTAENPLDSGTGFDEQGLLGRGAFLFHVEGYSLVFLFCKDKRLEFCNNHKKTFFYK